MLHVVSSSAALQGERTAFMPLLREAFRRGRPAPVDVMSHVANFLLPERVQRSLATRFGRLSAARHRG
ncbi:hypothetical protein D3C83_207520 [compost metagenome]